MTHDPMRPLRRAAHLAASVAPFGLVLEEGAPDRWATRPLSVPRPLLLEKAELLLQVARDEVGPTVRIEWDGTIQRVSRLTKGGSVNHPTWNLMMAIFEVSVPVAAHATMAVAFPVAYP